MAIFRHPAQRVVASSLLVQLTIVVTGPLAVRLLGVEGRGEAAMVFAAALLVGQVAPFGLPQAFGYSIASGEADARTLIRAYAPHYALRSLLAGAAGASLLAAIFLVRPVADPVGGVIVGGVGTAVTMAAVLVVSCLQGAGRFTALAVVQLVPGGFYVAALVALMLLDHASVITVLVLYFAGWAATALAGLALLVGGGGQERGLPPLARLRSFGRRAIVAASAPIDNLGIDQLAVGLLLGAHELGTYVVALAFKTPLTLVLTSIAGVCTTQVAGLSDPAAARAYCRRWLVIALAAGVVVVAGLEVAIDLVLVPAFGPEAGTAREAAHWLVLAGLPLGLRRVTAGMLQGIGHPADASRVELAGLTVMGVGMVTMTGPLGVTGAVAAVGLGALVAAGGGLLALRHRLRQRPTA